MADILEQSRFLRTTVPGPASQALDSKRQEIVAAGVSSAAPIYVQRAHGGIIEDVDGNRIIDLSSGIGVTTVGHTDPAVTEAIVAQTRDFTHTMFPIAPYQEYVDVVRRLAALTPGDFAKKGLLLNTGAEAVENAIKIARYYTGRRAVATLTHGYHGRTSLTMAMTYKAMPYRAGFGPFPPEIYQVPDSYPYRDHLDGEAAANRTIAALDKQIGAQDLAALVIEPIQGEGGFIVPAPGFLAAISQWAQDRGVVVVADEVQTGIGRTGKAFASEYEGGFVPDLVTIAKGIAGGLPLAAVIGRAEMVDAPHAGGLGGTFTGNPVACAAALAVLDQLEAGRLAAQARRIESKLKPGLQELAREHECIGEVRGRGAMLAIEIVKPGTEDPAPELQAQIVKGCLERGVLVLNAGTYGNVVRFLPNIAVSDELIDDALAVLREVLMG